MRIFSSQRLSDLLDDPIINASGLARICNISPSHLSELKNGKSEPKANSLVALADALGKPLDYFFVES